MQDGNMNFNDMNYEGKHKHVKYFNTRGCIVLNDAEIIDLLECSYGEIKSLSLLFSDRLVDRFDQHEIIDDALDNRYKPKHTDLDELIAQARMRIRDTVRTYDRHLQGYKNNPDINLNSFREDVARADALLTLLLDLKKEADENAV